MEISATSVAYSRQGLLLFRLDMLFLDGSLIVLEHIQPRLIPVQVPGICQNELICSKIHQCLC